MKNLLKKLTKLIPKTTTYFFDFFVVFIGVFLAFWLQARKEEQNNKQKEIQVYRSIYEDLNAFYVSGREENKDGFINLFQDSKKNLDSLISIRQLPAQRRFYGDYWHLEIVNALSNNAILTNIDAELFKGLANTNTSHQMFLDEIHNFNVKYEEYVTADYEKGMDHFYKPDSNEPKEKIKVLQHLLERIISLSKMLVEISENAKNGLQDEFNFE